VQRGALAGVELGEEGRRGGGGWCRGAGGRERRWRRKRWEESEGSGGPRERSGARGGELREGMRRKMRSLSWESRERISTRKSAPQLYFRFPEKRRWKKFELTVEAFGGILALFCRESDFNRNQTGPYS
jgi:hypothetical protein